MKLIKIFEGEVLTEAQDYKSFFNDFISFVVSQSQTEEEQYGMLTDYTFDINRGIKWAKSVLRKNNAIVWYLRLLKFYCYYSFISVYKQHLDFEMLCETVSALKKLSEKVGFDPRANIIIGTIIGSIGGSERGMTQLRIEHFMSLPIPQIQNYDFGSKPLRKVMEDFENFERIWKSERQSLIPVNLNSFKKIVIDFGDGWVWVDLGRGACSEEAKAMGHCGNVPSEKSGDTILSLRKYSADKKYWSPHLTFILHSDGSLGEMKGRGNDKPAEKYHGYIVKLLMTRMIKSMTGGGYQPENNFSLADLNDEILDILLLQKPKLMDARTAFRVLNFDRPYKTEARWMVIEAINNESDETFDLVGGRYGVVRMPASSTKTKELDIRFDIEQLVSTKMYEFINYVSNIDIVPDFDFNVLPYVRSFEDKLVEYTIKTYPMYSEQSEDIEIDNAENAFNYLEKVNDTQLYNFMYHVQGVSTENNIINYLNTLYLEILNDLVLTTTKDTDFISIKIDWTLGDISEKLNKDVLTELNDPKNRLTIFFDMDSKNWVKGAVSEIVDLYEVYREELSLYSNAEPSDFDHAYEQLAKITKEAVMEALDYFNVL